MGIEVSKGRGLTEAEALAEAVGEGLIVIVQDMEQGEEDTVHWHTWDTHLYCIDGEAQLTDGAGTELVMEAGDHVVVPRRTLHAASATRPTRLVVGITQELLDGIAVARPPEELDAQ